jgi:hypothetical protein
LGLNLEVGILADLKRHDPDRYQNYREEFLRLNQFLVDSGLEHHQEPEDLPAEQVFSCQMWGYSGLHHLRRIAAHLALGISQVCCEESRPSFSSSTSCSIAMRRVTIYLETSRRCSSRPSR